jgi:hypothetical protein
LLERRPKVAANLAPPSYCGTSATVNRLATATINPSFVPSPLPRESFRFADSVLHGANEFVVRDHKSVTGLHATA